jgi:hypothetical protein
MEEFRPGGHVEGARPETVTDLQQVGLNLGGPEEPCQFVAEQMRIWGPVPREDKIKGER